MVSHSFKYGHAAGWQWQESARACLEMIGRVPRAANLGFLYVTDLLVPHISEILTFFKAQTGIPHWVGTVGVGVCSTGREYLNQPAMVAMLAELPEGSFNVFRDVTRGARIRNKRANELFSSVMDRCSDGTGKRRCGSQPSTSQRGRGIVLSGKFDRAKSCA